MMRDTILRLLPANRGSIAVEFTLIFYPFYLYAAIGC